MEYNYSNLSKLLAEQQKTLAELNKSIQKEYNLYNQHVMHFSTQGYSEDDVLSVLKELWEDIDGVDADKFLNVREQIKEIEQFIEQLTAEMKRAQKKEEKDTFNKKLRDAGIDDKDTERAQDEKDKRISDIALKIIKKPSIKNIVGLLTSAGGALTGFIGSLVSATVAIAKFIDSSVNKWNSYTSKLQANGQGGFLSDLVNTGKSGIDSFKKGLSNITDAITKSVAIIWGGVTKIANLIPDGLNALLKAGGMDTSWAEEQIKSKYNSSEQNSILLDSTVAGKTAGFSGKDAEQFASNQLGLMNSLNSKLGNGADATKVKDAINNAVISGDYSGLNDLGIGISEQHIKSEMYKQGWNPNVAYSDAKMMGMRQSAIEKLLNFTDEELAESKKQGMLLEHINQSFAWEGVEAISGVDTSTGYYDKDGNYIADAPESKKGTVTKSAPVFANINGAMKYASELQSMIAQSKWSGIGSSMFHAQAKDIISTTDRAYNRNLPTLPDLMSSTKQSVDINVKVETNDDKFNAYVEDKVTSTVYKSNNTFTSPNVGLFGSRDRHK